jgi:hypothetical protein
MVRLGYVFGYGSLVAAAGGVAGLDRERRPRGFVADLPGYRRHWGVAMDNSRAQAGYKRYRDPDGRIPAVFVAFLDIAPDPGGVVNGVCRPVDAAALQALDARERNYERVEVSATLRCPGPVWTYVGSAAGRARLAAGATNGAAVVQDEYLAAVRTGFQALGAAEWALCAPSLDPGGLPVVALTREDL